VESLHRAGFPPPTRQPSPAVSFLPSIVVAQPSGPGPPGVLERGVIKVYAPALRLPLFTRNLVGRQVSHD
jgi:hypothetical protein